MCPAGSDGALHTVLLSMRNPVTQERARALALYLHTYDMAGLRGDDAAVTTTHVRPPPKALPFVISHSLTFAHFTNISM